MARRDSQSSSAPAGEPGPKPVTLYVQGRALDLGNKQFGPCDVLEPGAPLPTAADLESAKAAVSELQSRGVQASPDERHEALWRVKQLEVQLQALADPETMERLLVKGLVAQDPPPPRTKEAAVQLAGKAQRQIGALKARAVELQARLEAAEAAGDQARVEAYSEALAALGSVNEVQ